MSTQREKIPHVSYYPVVSRKTGVIRWRLTYTLNGRRITERLGTIEKNAKKRARTVSELIDSIKSNLVPPEEAKRLLSDNKEIGQHVEAYERHLTQKNNDQDYINTTLQRVRDMIGLMDATRAKHVTAGAVEAAMGKLAEKKIADGRGKPTDQNLSPQTQKHYLRSIKQFARWMKRTGILLSDPLENVEGPKIAGDVRHPRRAPTAEEIRHLIAFAASATREKWNAMKGADRAQLYAYAFTTGLRAAELHAAQVNWLRLTGETPMIVVPGKFTKNGKDAAQPIPSWLASAASEWLHGRTGDLFPRMPEKPIKMFRKDLRGARARWMKQQIEEAGAEPKKLEANPFLAYRTDDGYLDFHALRHGYGSTLAESDAEVKLIQSLMRHSTVELTMNRYAHARHSRAAAAVEKAMPNVLPNREKRKREAQRLSGTVSANKTQKEGVSRNPPNSGKRRKRSKN